MINPNVYEEILVLTILIFSQIDTFAETQNENDDDEKEECRWGNSNGIQLHFGFGKKDRDENQESSKKRKKYLLDEGYRCFITFEFSKHKR